VGAAHSDFAERAKVEVPTATENEPPTVIHDTSDPNLDPSWPLRPRARPVYGYWEPPAEMLS